MKPLAFLFVFCITACFGQSPYFNKFFKVGYQAPVSQLLITMKDSTYLIESIIKDSTSGRTDCGLLKIDKYGNEIVKRVTNYQNTDFAWVNKGYTNMLQISNTSIILCDLNFHTSNPINVIFSKINAITLDTVFNKYYSDSYYYYMSSIVKLHSNKFLLIGTKTNTTTNDFWPCYMEIDTTLNILNTYSVAYTNTLGITDAKLNPQNKKIIMAGIATINSKPCGGLIEADTLGNISNSYIEIDALGNGYTQVFYSAFDNTYVTIGLKRTGTFGTSAVTRLFVSKFNSNTLQPIWKKTYGQGQYITNLQDAVINPDGSIVTCGEYSDSTANMLVNSNPNGVILKIAANGDSLWMRQYGNYGLQQPLIAYEELFKGIEKTGDGGYIVCGMPYSAPNPKVWALRVDSMGCFNTSCSASNVGINENQINGFIIIYPNPANDKLFIQSESQNVTYINIVDILGREISPSSVKEKEIDISNFSKGIYFVNCKVNDQFRSLKFVKE
jgi:hypothetical protein